MSRAVDPLWGSVAPHVLAQEVAHGHHERHHQGKRHVLRLPTVSHETKRQRPMACRERCGGLLQDDTRKPPAFFDPTG
jgi:hypothetical protein